MRLMLFAAGVLGLCLGQAPALARCTLNIDSPGQVRFAGNSGAGYEGFNRARFDTDFSISISNEGSETCNARLSVQRTDAADLRSGGGDRLDYAVTLPGSLATIVDNQIDVGNPPHAVPVTIASGQTQVQHLAFRIPPGQIVASGEYHATVRVRLLDASDLDISAERTVELVTTVRPEMSVMLYDSGLSSLAAARGTGSHNRTLDFGILRDNAEASLTVLVQSNDDYSLRFTSPHGGALWHETRGAADRIGYTAYFGGRAPNLTSGEDYVPSVRATGLNGVSQPLRVRIGQVGLARAGRYQDQLTITVLPD